MDPSLRRDDSVRGARCRAAIAVAVPTLHGAGMKLGILEAGAPPAELLARFGRYPEMFRQLLGEDFEYESYDVAAGALPADAADHDAYLVTGSAAGVYEPLAWIAPANAFLRAAKGKA